jgi:phosphate transport system substrate-binding protein
VAVFDGTKATSTVRFIVDSVLRGEKLSPDVVAAQTSEGVIDYIAGARNAVGFIGVSWIGNREDTTQLNYLSKVKVVQLQHIADSTLYVSPAQYNIYYRRYPMVRDLIYTLKEKHNGLGHAFAYFLTGQRGQLIFKRAYLMPAQMRFNLRSANLREE